jgi:hypothetical protein
VYPLGNLKQLFINALESRHPEFLAKFNELSMLNYNPRIEILEFQAFIESSRHEIDIQLFLLDANWNEVFNADSETSYAQSSIEIIENLSYFSAELNDLDEIYFNDTDEMINSELTAYLSAIYDQSSLSELKRYLYFTIHDGPISYDLKKKVYFNM